MTGDEVKAAREAAGMSQAQLAEALGVNRKTVVRWEGGAVIPDGAAANIGRALAGGVAVAAPKAPKAAPVKVQGAPLAVIAKEARADLDAPMKKRLGIPKDARRPTAAEVRQHPQRYSGPNVWVAVHTPPERLKGGQTVARTIYKGSANGHGGVSIQLVGTCSKGKADADSLAPGIYRPFHPGGGESYPKGGPGEGKRKAA